MRGGTVRTAGIAVNRSDGAIKIYILAKREIE